MKKSIGARTIILPTPVLVVGTYDQQGRPNVMTAAWGGVCCSRPPCIAVSLRKATYTHGNILARKAFTISIPSQKYLKYADYFGMVSGRDTDKFARSGLSAVRSEAVDAPYVGEFPLVLECRLAQIVEIGSHTQFIGEVLDVKAEESVLGANGFPEADKVKPCAYSPAEHCYLAVGARLGAGFTLGKEVA